jgi:hypothetical protein
VKDLKKEEPEDEEVEKTPSKPVSPTPETEAELPPDEMLGENSKQNDRKSTRTKRKPSEIEASAIQISNKKQLMEAPKPVLNGSLPKVSGKPMMSALTKKVNKPRKRKKPLFTTYQSEVSQGLFNITQKISQKKYV